MSRDARIHELLPWYVAGTLGSADADEFREHLSGCETCSTEMDFIKKLKTQIDRHGDAFLEDHPPAARLVGVVRGEIEGDEARLLRRHLAVCAACATEARWVTGETSFAEASVDSERSSGRRSWIWLAAAAALVVVVVAPRLVTTPAPSGVVPHHFVRPTERAGDSQNVYRWQEGADRLSLLFEVDFAPAAYPLSLRIVEDSGREVFRDDRIPQDSVRGGAYLLFDCNRRTCRPGAYSAVIAPSGGDAPDHELRFRVES